MSIDQQETEQLCRLLRAETGKVWLVKPMLDTFSAACDSWRVWIFHGEEDEEVPDPHHAEVMNDLELDLWATASTPLEALKKTRAQALVELERLQVAVAKLRDATLFLTETR